MEISSSFTQLNASITRSSESPENAEQELNAFGIGAANNPKLQLSPQARILNEIDRINSIRQQELDEQLDEQNSADDESGEENSVSDYQAYVAETAEPASVKPPNYAQRALDLYLSVQNQS